MRLSLIGCIVLLSAAVVCADKPADLVIHEWGTFTSLQNARGEAIGGINIDDEPVPQFVHSLDENLLQQRESAIRRRREYGGKGAFTVGPHPDITMRLETPVVYFYEQRPVDKPLPPLNVDLSVTFKGGFLTQYYPNAASPTPAVTVNAKSGDYMPITEKTTHTLDWQGLQIGAIGEGPKTTDRVWTAPREVKANNVRATNGESEKFLFYRGVGHLDSPVRVIQRQPGKVALGLYGASGDVDTRVTASWMVDVQPNGTVAFRVGPCPAVGPTVCASPAGVDEVSTTFESTDYAAENLERLKTAMHKSLVAQGLFPDEAAAMLNTWEASYFKSPGLRVFYIVPKNWVEQVLPMKVSVPVDITRVMVGRIELISPAQADLLKTITDVKDISKLGRFTGALLNDENARNPSPRLAKLIVEADLQPAKVAR